MSVGVIDLTSPCVTDDENTVLGIVPNASQRQGSRSKRKRRSKIIPSATNLPTHHKQSDSTPTRKRKRSEGSQNAGESVKQASNVETTDAFFIDLNPAPLPLAPFSPVPTISESQHATEKLLIPSHVTVLGKNPGEITAQPSLDDEDEDFIDYLDYEDARPMNRYYNDSTSDSGPNKIVCKNCGANGQHRTSACTVQICLTCGVRDEHPTRSCPISKVCFTCGMKGHINANCPNRRSAHALLIDHGSKCDRCTSSRHKANECPTLWRLYKYFSAEDRARTFVIRQLKKDLQLGQGGEGYVANDEWCYNCGGYGHWGDDCYGLTHNHFPEEYSAFSNLNLMSGPFNDLTEEGKNLTTLRARHDFVSADVIGSVGRQARMKSKAAMARQAQEAEDATDDWFQTASKQSGTSSSRSNESKKIKIGEFSIECNSHRPPTSASSLMERIGNFALAEPRRNVDVRPDQFTDRNHKKEERRPSGRSTNRSHHLDTGPRYRGGYRR